MKRPEFELTQADEFIVGDLRDARFSLAITEPDFTLFQLAADMGGAGYVFTGENDAAIMHDSATINLNMLEVFRVIGLQVRHIPGPQGVRGRNSDNRFIRTTLGWEPEKSLQDGLTRTYVWIQQHIEQGN